jgi:hypothetical protein
MRTFIEADACPGKGFQDVFLCSGHKAVLIGVFNPQQAISAVFAGKKIIVQGCAHPADMQGAGRTRGKAHPYASIAHAAKLGQLMANRPGIAVYYKVQTPNRG